MKITTISILIAGVIIAGAIILTKNSSNNNTLNNGTNNVKMENGIQVVEIKARGGYFPKTSTAKAGIPTILRFNTQSTFDCSSSIRIPSLGISKSLPLTGTTDIDLGVQKLGTLQGSCGMGMYPFEVSFES